MSPILSSLAVQVREQDNDRYLCSLFAPEAQREGLFALYAFNQEVARIREKLTEPMMGFIRLAWWREAIEELYTGKVRNHEVLQGLYPLIQKGQVSHALFNQLIDGREQDMEEAPSATMEALEAYGCATSVPVFQLALEILDVKEEAAMQAAVHVGVAWMLVGYLRAARFFTASNRVLFPADRMREAGITAADIIAGKQPEKTRMLAELLCQRAQFHLDEAATLRRDVPRTALPALLPASIAQGALRHIAKAGYAILEQDIEKSRLAVQLQLLMRNIGGRFC